MCIQYKNTKVDLYEYLYQNPNRRDFKSSFNLLTPAELEKYFIAQDDLSASQKEILSQIYNDSNYHTFLKSLRINSTLSPRRFTRLDISYKCLLNDNCEVVAKKMSLNGLQLSCHQRLEVGERVNIKIRINEYEVVQVKARVRYKNRSTYGLAICGEATHWFNYWKDVSSHFHSQVA